MSPGIEDHFPALFDYLIQIVLHHQTLSLFTSRHHQETKLLSLQWNWANSQE
jgi:hypothetical protein